MSTSQSDALVFFGATGDLAFKKIFPALQAMAKRGRLDVPVIGVGRSDWTADQLRARARESLEKQGEVDPVAHEKLSSLLRYVSVDYAKPATFQALCKELGGAKRPAHYLAIPPQLFETVVQHLDISGCAKGARVLEDATLFAAYRDEVPELAAEIDHMQRRELPTDWDIFEKQTQEYRDIVLPPEVTARVAIEQGSTLGWERYVGASGQVIGMNTFGASAPLKELQKKFGFEPGRLAAAAKKLLKNQRTARHSSSPASPSEE